MPINYRVVLVPSLYGNRACPECKGYGWSYGYLGGEFARVDCAPCEGNGWFREETEILPVEDGYPLQSPELSRDDFGRHVHITCNGGGVRFFMQCGEYYWTCTSCKKYGFLSVPEWKVLQNQGRQPNLLVNARGAELLLQLRSSH